jgi:putative Holliday junction resolvase
MKSIKFAENYQMARILAIDYGRKRVGIAVTDELQITSNGLTTVNAKEALGFITDYCKKEQVEIIVVGDPRQMDNSLSESARYIEPFLGTLKKALPDIPIDRMDERFTSKLAFQAMIDGGLKQKARRNKALVDQISATIILQSYLESKNQQK